MYSQLSTINDVPNEFADRMLAVFGDQPASDGFLGVFGRKRVTIRNDELLSRGLHSKIHASIVDLQTGFVTFERLVNDVLTENHQPG